MNLNSFPCAIEPCSTTNSQPSLDIRGTYTQAVACGSWVGRCYGEHRRKRDGARYGTFHYTKSGVRCTPVVPSRQRNAPGLPKSQEMQIKERKIRRFNIPRISRSGFVALLGDERLSIIPLHRSAAPLPLTLSLKLPRSKSKKLEARREGGGTGPTLCPFALRVVVVGFGKCNSMS